jgi:hypothetical protein
MIEGGYKAEGGQKYARLAARVLMEQPWESPPVDVRRDEVVAAMALAIAAKARRRRMVMVSVTTLAAAASLLVVLRLAGSNGLSGAKPGTGSALVVERATGIKNQLVRAASTQPLPDLGVLAVGDTVRSGEDGSAVLGFGNGTRITLSSSAHLRVDDLGSTRRFSLFAGHLQAHVAKLAQGERFIVSTPDGEVEVRGTVFTVAVESSPSWCRDLTSGSAVRVSEGAVWVRSGDKEVVLQPGETWVTPCPDPRVIRNAETAGRGPLPNLPAPPARTGMHKSVTHKVIGVATPVLGQNPSPVAPAPASVDTMVPPAPVSRLAEQNDLFSAAMAAERMGQHDVALRKLDELTTRYPGGPLSESARVERRRILAARDLR